MIALQGWRAGGLVSWPPPGSTLLPPCSPLQALGTRSHTSRRTSSRTYLSRVDHLLLEPFFGVPVQQHTPGFSESCS